MTLFAKPRGGVRFKRGLLKAPKLIRVNANSPAGILFITDLHLRPSHPEMADTVLGVCAGVKPDVVLLGGDLSEYNDGLGIFLQKLRQRFEGVPAFAVPGNNDSQILGGDRGAQRRVYRKYGVDYLLNEKRTLEINGKKVEIAGLEDAYLHKPDPSGLLSADKNSYKIILAHQPLKSSLVPQADLMLCGHTHGGQINVLGLTCYLLIGYERQYKYACLAGQKRVGDTLLLVSRGIGYSKYPLRVGARSEVHFIL